MEGLERNRGVVGDAMIGGECSFAVDAEVSGGVEEERWKSGVDPHRSSPFGRSSSPRPQLVAVGMQQLTG